MACEAQRFNTSKMLLEGYVGKTPREGVHFWNAHCRLDLEASDLILPSMPTDLAQIALERVLAAVGQCLDRQRRRVAAPSTR